MTGAPLRSCWLWPSRHWVSGDGGAAIALFDRAADAAEAEGDLQGRTTAVLGLARAQRYNLTPGQLPVRLHATYDAVDDPQLRARLSAALARCWAYANEPRRARPFAIEALHLADRQDDPVLLADALDAALASHWGPDGSPSSFCVNVSRSHLCSSSVPPRRPRPP